jgi:hypothetical protein
VKDSQGLSKIEEEYNLESKLFKSVVDTNKVMIQRDVENNIPETVDGPNQISFEEMSKLANL